MNFDLLTKQSISQKPVSREHAHQLLTSPAIELLPLISSAYDVRKHFWGQEVTVHILTNAQNGNCQEDCHYCAQAKTSEAAIDEYSIKSDDEILAEAKDAYESGAFRYCMVFAGRGPSASRVEHVAELIKKIKAQYPLQICVSAGLIDDDKAETLKHAGLDRLNHNLNTSKAHYPKICTTHTFDDRVNTLISARKAGIQLCSGIIVGMGEAADDILDVAFTLRDLNVESIPINFLMPIKGNKLDNQPDLTPTFCLRVLCLFRFINPAAEIRIAAGREMHLRSMEVMGLYPANSLFLDGYLNTPGESQQKTLQMIQDAGFSIKTDKDLEKLIKKAQEFKNTGADSETDTLLKSLDLLRPHMEAK